jgi:hypothetical protein
MQIRGFLPEEFALMLDVAGFEILHNQVMKGSPYHFASVGQKRKKRNKPFAVPQELS